MIIMWCTQSETMSVRARNLRKKNKTKTHTMAEPNEFLHKMISGICLEFDFCFCGRLFFSYKSFDSPLKLYGRSLVI